MAKSKGALDGLFVLDLSRILAGPTSTQLLGDLGATVIKVENPKTGGDDTRGWGPNYALDKTENALISQPISWLQTGTNALSRSISPPPRAKISFAIWLPARTS